MKYMNDILRMQVFTKQEMTVVTGNGNTADSILRAYLQKGAIKRVRRNLYAAVSPERHTILPTPFAIGSHIKSDAFISHHSAFEFYGMGNQVFETAFVSMATPVSSFSFDGMTYKTIKGDSSWGVEKHGLVRVSDLERTIVDSIKDLGKYIGLEELLSCLEFVTALDEEKMLAYLKRYDNSFLWRKTGFILKRFPATFLSEEFFKMCLQHSNNSVRYLFASVRSMSKAFNKEYQLVIPAWMTQGA